MIFTQKIKIGSKYISEKSKTFVIAEIGVNHNGSISLAKKLINLAKSAGADAVKFQLFKAENLILKNVDKADYQIKNHKKNQTQYEMLEDLQVDINFLKIIKKYCVLKRIEFIVTPYDEKSLDEVIKLGISAIKVASTDTNNFKFLSKISKCKLPIIYSTGMTEMKDIEQGVKTINKFSKKLIILQCTSDYPSKNNEIHLNVISSFKKKFKCIVGFSDHTKGIGASPYAVALGAKIIEKHFTLNKNFEGPDHKASLEPKELKQLIKEIRNVEKYLGSFQKKITKSEKTNQKKMQKYIVTKKNMYKNEKLTLENLSFKRTGGIGIKSSNYRKVLNKKINRNINIDTPLKFSYLAK